MTIRTNASGKVILTVSSDVKMQGGYIVHLNSEMPIDEETQTPKPKDGIVYVESIPEVNEGYELYFDGTSFYQMQNPYYAKAKERYALEQELKYIQQWLFDNDWKVNKIVIGEWSTTDSRWIAYLTERDNKRRRQDEINAILSTM